MTTRVVIVGGGVVGLETARRLERSDEDVAVTLVDPQGIHVYQPLLPEVSSGSIDPRHAVVALRTALPRTEVISGSVLGHPVDDGRVRIRRPDGAVEDRPFDHLVVGVGSISRVMPIPGLVERAVGFQTVAEALHLRDRVLERMQLADSSGDPDRRRRALTFVVVGGGYSGVEAAGEMHALATAATQQFHTVEPDDVRLVIVEATDRILPMVGPSLRQAALERLQDRGVEVRLGTLVESVDDEAVRLSDGDALPADTLVWCAGVRPSPLGGELGLPVTDDGAVVAEPDLSVAEHPHVWVGGDCGSIPDLVEGGTCPPSAQYALRQGRHIATNVVRRIRGEETVAFRYAPIGEMITLGHADAVGEIRGMGVTGWAAWALRAGYHVARMPTPSRKVRLTLDWTMNLLFPREITSLGSVRHPEEPLEEAAEVAAHEASSDGGDGD